MGYMFSKYAEVMLKTAGQDCILQKNNKTIRCLFNAVESINYQNYNIVQKDNILTISYADLKDNLIAVDDLILVDEEIYQVDAVLNLKDGFVNLNIKLYVIE